MSEVNLREDGPVTALDRRALLALAPEARLGALRASLRWRAARALKVSVAEVAVDRPLSGLGLDSLGAIELGTGVESSLGVALPLARLLEGASLEDLAREVLAALERPGA